MPEGSFDPVLNKGTCCIGSKGWEQCAAADHTHLLEQMSMFTLEIAAQSQCSTLMIGVNSKKWPFVGSVFSLGNSADLEVVKWWVHHQESFSCNSEMSRCCLWLPLPFAAPFHLQSSSHVGWRTNSKGFCYQENKSALYESMSCFEEVRMSSPTPNK